MPDQYSKNEQYEKKPATQSVYKAPRIVEFGPVGTLTQAGSELGMEMGAGMGNNMMMA